MGMGLGMGLRLGRMVLGIVELTCMAILSETLNTKKRIKYTDDFIYMHAP